MLLRYQFARTIGTPQIISKHCYGPKEQMYAFQIEFAHDGSHIPFLTRDDPLVDNIPYTKKINPNIQ